MSFISFYVSYGYFKTVTQLIFDLWSWKTYILRFSIGMYNLELWLLYSHSFPINWSWSRTLLNTNIHSNIQSRSVTVADDGIVVQMASFNMA